MVSTWEKKKKKKRNTSKFEYAGSNRNGIEGNGWADKNGEED